MKKSNQEEIIYAVVGFAMCLVMCAIVYIGLWLFH